MIGKRQKLLSKDEVDKKYKERVRRMEINLNERIRLIETSAVVGLITRNLIHDMTNPLSGLEGILRIIDSEKIYDSELMTLAFESISQMKMIIFETRDLISGRDIVQVVNVSDNISSILRILNIDLERHKIQVFFEPKDRVYILGMKGLLLRIIINLIVNSIEVLKRKTKDRKIYFPDFPDFGVLPPVFYCLISVNGRLEAIIFKNITDYLFFKNLTINCGYLPYKKAKELGISSINEVLQGLSNSLPKFLKVSLCKSDKMGWTFNGEFRYKAEALAKYVRQLENLFFDSLENLPPLVYILTSKQINILNGNISENAPAYSNMEKTPNLFILRIKSLLVVVEISELYSSGFYEKVPEQVKKKVKTLEEPVLSIKNNRNAINAVIKKIKRFANSVYGKNFTFEFIVEKVRMEEDTYFFLFLAPEEC